MSLRVARGFDPLAALAEEPLGGRASLARSRLRTQALALARSEALVEAAYSYCIVALEEPVTEWLCAGAERLHAPWLLPASGRLTAIACGACTLGPLLERRVALLFAERRASLAVALDQLGNEALMAVGRRAEDRIAADVARRGLTMAGELRAGDPGLALQAQAAVLRLAQAETVGVSVNASHLMLPLKSTSMVLGVGVDLPAAQWSRCDHCPTRDRCAVPARAASAQAAAGGAG